MKRTTILVVLIFLSTLISYQTARAQQALDGRERIFHDQLLDTLAGDPASDDGANLVGNWTGDSICIGNRPACHDEKVIYRIPKPPDEKGIVTITADKIVNGKPETMGALDFKYDREKHELTCDFTRGTTHGFWEFNVKEDTMDGTLIVLPDQNLARRVKLKKRKLNSAS